MNRWIAEENVQDCDQTAPEVMAGTMYSRRFTSDEPVNGFYAVVTVQFYCDDQWMASGEDIHPDDLALSNPVPVNERYRIGQIVEFIRCTNLDDVSDYEWTAQRYRYSWFARAEKFTDEQIKAVAEKFAVEWIGWDGNEAADDVDTLKVLIEPVDDEDWDQLILTEELQGWLFLRETFEFEVCHECHLDADAHIAKRDMLGNWHAWCRIADPVFAMKVVRERVESADTAKAANGFSDEDLRADQFEAAVIALEAAGKLIVEPDTVMLWRKMANWDDPAARAGGRRFLEQMLGALGHRMDSAAKEDV